ncbi:phosphoribosyltransferase [Niveibacterium sp. SC-1]|uniref:phosphoribosyltransferase n=1 Tax=Niveibacterium sp. SC-1 TaxID=3135646 RepID=UPI00311F9234
MGETGGDIIERRLKLYDVERLDLVLDWMAAQSFAMLAEVSRPVMIGIAPRGASVAARLQQRLEARYGLAVSRYEIWAERPADDAPSGAPLKILEPDALAARDLTGCNVLVVDALLARGRTLSGVMEHVRKRRVASVNACVLVDRCAPGARLRAAVAGLCLEFPASVRLEAHIPPHDKDFGVWRIS